MKGLLLPLLLLGATTWGWAAPAASQAPDQPSDDISGMYSFLQEGEFVQINVEEGTRLTGFVSRYSDGEKALFLDHFFEKGEIKGRNLSFSTRKVHGVWFDFKGKVERGEAKTRQQEGYFLMHGTLVQYTTDANKVVTAKSREVTFKSFPQDAEDSAPPAKPN